MLKSQKFWAGVVVGFLIYWAWMAKAARKPQQ